LPVREGTFRGRGGWAGEKGALRTHHREGSEDIQQEDREGSLLTLTDPDLKDLGALERIYDLAIQHRLSVLGVEEDEPEDDDVSRAPAISDAIKTRLETSVAPLPPVPLVAKEIAASDTR